MWPPALTPFCGIASPALKDPPIQPCLKACLLLKLTGEENHHCPRCHFAYSNPQSVRKHFTRCISDNGNPEGLRWLDYYVINEDGSRSRPGIASNKKRKAKPKTLRFVEDSRVKIEDSVTYPDTTATTITTECITHPVTTTPAKPNPQPKRVRFVSEAPPSSSPSPAKPHPSPPQQKRKRQHSIDDSDDDYDYASSTPQTIHSPDLDSDASPPSQRKRRRRDTSSASAADPAPCPPNCPLHPFRTPPSSPPPPPPKLTRQPSPASDSDTAPRKKHQRRSPYEGLILGKYGISSEVERAFERGEIFAFPRADEKERREERKLEEANKRALAEERAREMERFFALTVPDDD